MPFPCEVVEDAQLIAVQVSDPELTQVPGLVFRPGNNPGAASLPSIKEFIDSVPATAVQPDGHRSRGFCLPSKEGVSQKEAAIPLRYSGDAAFFVAPVQSEPEYVDVVRAGFIDVSDRQFGNGSRKALGHANKLMPEQRGTSGAGDKPRDLFGVGKNR